jgi:hypothetical protein
MSCDNNVTSFLLAGVVGHQKKANFSRRQDVLLIQNDQNKTEPMFKLGNF